MHDYTEPRAPWGTKARGVAAVGAEARVPRLAPCAPHFPPMREIRDYPSGLASTRFPRYQSATLTLAATTAWQEVVRFAGRPDSIDISASAAGVNIRLRNRGESEADAIRVPSAQFHETHITKEIVEAQDPTGAGGQLVNAHGMWIDATNGHHAD